MRDLMHGFPSSVLLYIGAGTGGCQGVIWTILSFVAIITHLTTRATMEVTLSTDSYQEIFRAYMYYIFIKYNGYRTNKLIQPGEFFAVMSLYFILSLAWIGSSLYLVYAYRRHHGRKSIFYTLLVWVIAGILTLILDLIFCCLLGADYSTTLKEHNAVDKSNIGLKLAYSYSVLSYGIVMVLAARGFILWIINLLITVVMTQLCLQFKSDSADDNITNEDIFHSTRRVPATELPDEVTNRNIDEIPRRRQTAPPPPLSPAGVSTSSSFNFNRFFGYDPQVDRRLEQYLVVPEENKYRKSS